MDLFEKIEEFEWDDGNILKNWEKHKVTAGECEEVFLNEPLIISGDERHSMLENRYLAFGQTNQGRKLTVIFTIRRNKVRVISARNQNRKERKFYEEN